MATADNALRGEAAFNALKREVAKRNENAFARARSERSASDVIARQRQLAAEKREFANLPKQPGRG
jgi:hypothetical protein